MTSILVWAFTNFIDPAVFDLRIRIDTKAILIFNKN